MSKPDTIMKTGLLFANGDITNREIRQLAEDQFDLIIAADGGAAAALKHGFRPACVVGDLDSVTPAVRQKLPGTIFVHRPSQESNDLEKALIHARQLGVTDLTVLGTDGQRLDHTLNNLSVLSRYDQDFDLRLLTPHAEVFIVRDRWDYRGPVGKTISLIPLARAGGVRTRGLAFPLDNDPLEFGQREGLSNYSTQESVSVRIRSGLLFVFVLYESQP